MTPLATTPYWTGRLSSMLEALVDGPVTEEVMDVARSTLDEWREFRAAALS